MYPLNKIEQKHGLKKTRSPRARFFIAIATATGALALFSGCASSSPLSGDKPAASTATSGTITVGSQDYYSNEIIAEIYAEALEAKGFKVERAFKIGQREVYIPEIESGKIDVFPEYSGNLLQYYNKTAKATKSDEVYDALKAALPDGLRVLDQSEASDQDSYVVTKAFADANGLTSIADLAKVTTPITLGGNSELKKRPYGPDGLKSIYGVTVGFTPIEDSGGPLTIKALTDNTVQLVDIYSASPAISTNNLVTLSDPEGMFLSSNVVPVVSSKITADAAAVINAVSSKLSAADLVSMNAESTEKKSSAATIAKAWLTKAGLS